MHSALAFHCPFLEFFARQIRCAESNCTGKERHRVILNVKYSRKGSRVINKPVSFSLAISL